MLARIVNARPDRSCVVVSIRGFSDDNLSMINHPTVRFEALGTYSPLEIWQAAAKLRTILVRENPDAVLCWMYHANVIGALATLRVRTGARLVWNIRASLDQNAHLSWSTKAALFLGKLLSRNAYGIIFNSARAVRNHSDIGYGHPNTRVVPNGFLLPIVQASTPRLPTVIGMIARFHPDKDHALFLKMATKLAANYPALRFVIAGRGVSDSNPAFATLIEATGIDRSRVTLLGELSDVSSFYKNIDILVLASRMEGFPNVLAEAMSYGVPAISSDLGDANYVVQGVGEVVPINDVEAMTDAVRRVLALTPTEFAERRVKARARVENLFDISTVAQQYDDFIFGENA